MTKSIACLGWILASQLFSPIYSAAHQAQPIAPLVVDFSSVKVQFQPPPPPYPPLARVAHIQGTVVVQVTLDPEGVPVSASAIDGPPELRRAAEDYAMSWRFAPVIREGQPLAVQFKISMPFRIKGLPDANQSVDLSEAASLIERGRECYRIRSFLDAATILAYATTLTPGDAFLWNDLGRAYHALRAEPRAIQSFQRAIQLNPRHPWAHNNLGLSLQAEKRYQEAEEAFKRQIEFVPEDQYAHRNLGILLTRLGRDLEAIPELEFAARIRPKDAVLLEYEGKAYLHLGDEKKALEVFDHALSLDVSPRNRNGIAYSLAQEGVALASARTWAEQSVSETEAALTSSMNQAKRLETTSELAAEWDTLGWVLFRQGDLPGAKNYLEAAAPLGGRADEFHHLGQAREAMGDRTGAIHAYARALVLPNPPDGVRECLLKLAPQAEAEALLDKIRQGGAKDLDITLGASGLEPGVAEFDCLLSNDGKVIEAHIHSGLESLRSMEKALLEAHHPFLMPNSNPIKLAVRVTHRNTTWDRNGCRKVPGFWATDGFRDHIQDWTLDKSNTINYFIGFGKKVGSLGGAGWGLKGLHTGKDPGLLGGPTCSDH